MPILRASFRAVLGALDEILDLLSEYIGTYVTVLLITKIIVISLILYVC